MRVAFRAAGSPVIGGGHVVRSLSLADALAAMGAACTFFVSEEAVAATPMLARSSHSVIAMPQDTQAAIASAKGLDSFDWLVMDDYGLGASEETPWRSLAKKILVVDDLADRAHDCDMLLDSTPSRNLEDYSGLAPPHARLLLGAAYAPLRSEFFLKRSIALARREQHEKSRRLLVSFGLTDPGGITAEAVAAIAEAMPGLAMDVVLGASSPSRSRIKSLGRANIALHIDPPSMSDLMIDADIALGAGGSTAWERACLALPAISLILADNQRALSRDLEKRGALISIEKNEKCWSNLLVALETLAEDTSIWRSMSLQAALICDGLGAQRLACDLNPPETATGRPVRLRPVRAGDSRIIHEWQIAPGARVYSSNPEPPSWENHETWMTRKLRDPRCIFNMIEEDDAPAGVLRMDQRLDGSFMVSILLCAAARGRGVGLAALRAGISLMPGHTLWAKIDGANTKSLRLFANAGFTQYDQHLYRHIGSP